MNSKTSRLFRQVKADNDGLIAGQSDVLRVEWNAASSHRARGHVNSKLRAIVARQRVIHAKKMEEAKRGEA